jgi:hypothetical protein
MFPQRDQQLLAEAYSLQLLKESFPKMTLKQVISNLEEFNESEKIWVEEFSQRIIDELLPEELVLEFLDGLKNVGRSILGGAANVGGKLATGASKLGQGVKDAASQVGQNVKDVYNSAEDEAKFTKGATQAKELAFQLAELIKDAQSKGLVTFSEDPMTMPLGELVDELILAQKGSKQRAGSAQRAGVFKGAGKAFKKAL